LDFTRTEARDHYVELYLIIIHYQPLFSLVVRANPHSNIKQWTSAILTLRIMHSVIANFNKTICVLLMAPDI
jgi:hypothetical protein